MPRTAVRRPPGRAVRRRRAPIKVDGTHRSGRMAGRAARHRFPHDAAAVARAGVRIRPKPGSSRRPKASRSPSATRSPRACRAPARRRSATRGAQVDRVNLYVDFDGDGRTGYNFTVTAVRRHHRCDHHQREPVQHRLGRHLASTPSAEDDERLVGGDADPLVHRADAERQGRQAHARHLPRPRDRHHRRTHVRGRRSSFERPRFLVGASTPIEVPEYSQSLLAITPYVVGAVRQRRHASDFDTGADIFWKPNGQFQLTRHAQSRLRPGRERPAGRQLQRDRNLLQRQAPVLHREPGLLRRAVRLAQQRQPADLHAPRRWAGRRRQRRRRRHRGGQGQRQRSARFNYGVFAATEADEVGRDFYALRVTRDFDTQGVGAMVTHVDRPFLDRQATVLRVRPPLESERAAGHPHHRWSAATSQQPGATTRDSGGAGAGRLRHGQRLAPAAVRAAPGRRPAAQRLRLPASATTSTTCATSSRSASPSLPDDSAYASHDWRCAASRRANDHGVHIADALVVRPGQRPARRRQRLLRDRRLHARATTTGSRAATASSTCRPSSTSSTSASARARIDWSLYWHVRYAAEGLDGPDARCARARFQPDLLRQRQPELLRRALRAAQSRTGCCWQRRQPARQLRADHAAAQRRRAVDHQRQAGTAGQAGDDRARRARAPGWRVAPNGTPVADRTIRSTDFSLRNLGFQVRYRYELAPLSNLYIVYVRGGFDSNRSRRTSAPLLGDSFSLRDSEQLLVKLSYRFEL